MLEDEVKKTIQSAYTELLEKYSFTPRQGQRQMIADIANSLGKIQVEEEGADADDRKPPICVVEAGTGTGKTLAYILAVIPVAQALNLKVVLATATVALQEQVILKDLPDILAGCDMEFSFAMAKGRGRYLCLARLDNMLAGNDSLNAMLDLYGDAVNAPEEGTRQLYQKMLEQIGAGKWEGDRDDWQEPILDVDWKPITVDTSQCIGSRCAHFKQCFFFKARESLDKVDCIVSNHDLVLADLALGGGVILPPPRETIYIFDEAHHLPNKSNNHFSAFTRVKSSITWLQQCDNAIARFSAEPGLMEAINCGIDFEELRKNIVATADRLNDAWLLLEQTAESVDGLDTYGNSQQHTFNLGQVPEEVRQTAADLETYFSHLFSQFQELQDSLKKLVDEATELQLRTLAEQWFPVIGGIFSRVASSLNLWASFARRDPESAAPSARWLTINEYNETTDISLSSSPVLAAGNLENKLWKECAAAILTSATLSALGRFDMLKMRAGLPDHTHYLSIPSPFDFQHNASLNIPKMNCAPSDTDKHTAIIIQALPELLNADKAALMLFSSRRQMQDVLQGLPAEWRNRVLCQDDYQKAQLLKFHRQRVDKGENSVIFGLASFAEGVDLPGKYCTHVLIAKIPFAVPNDPIEVTLSQWIENQGANPFMTLAVPEAAFKLVQGCGRLLRNETDQGKITIFDERLVNKFYGKTILGSLPPYRREIFQQQFEV
ncbi:MAG: ATP-dependent DNA helicase DinG [Gammaproteobacteria bacterium]|nr:ATP-dependent DNA helicase DinG [Gammaproteobacteria bacterium]